MRRREVLSRGAPVRVGTGIEVSAVYKYTCVALPPAFHFDSCLHSHDERGRAWTSCLCLAGRGTGLHSAQHMRRLE